MAQDNFGPLLPNNGVTCGPVSGIIPTTHKVTPSATPMQAPMLCTGVRRLVTGVHRQTIITDQVVSGAMVPPGNRTTMPMSATTTTWSTRETLGLQELIVLGVRVVCGHKVKAGKLHTTVYCRLAHHTR